MKDYQNREKCGTAQNCQKEDSDRYFHLDLRYFRYIANASSIAANATSTIETTIKASDDLCRSTQTISTGLRL